MRTLLRTATLLAMLVLGAVSLAEAQVSFDLHIGPPPPPRVVHVQPVRPGEVTTGSMAIGIPSGITTSGGTATGRGRRTRVRVGTHPDTHETSFAWATGTAIVAGTTTTDTTTSTSRLLKNAA
jgi:hypothetical protein